MGSLELNSCIKLYLVISISLNLLYSTQKAQDHPSPGMCPSCAFPAVPISKGGGVYTCTVIACILIPAWASTPSFHDRIPVETRQKPHRNTHSSQLGDLNLGYLCFYLDFLWVTTGILCVLKSCIYNSSLPVPFQRPRFVLPSIIPRRVSESPGGYRWVGSMEFCRCWKCNGESMFFFQYSMTAYL